jgi:hypothetical protein
MATLDFTREAGALKITGFQILPCFENDGVVTAQINGPDVETQFWSVYERWSDGRAVVDVRRRTPAKPNSPRGWSAFITRQCARNRSARFGGH